MRTLDEVLQASATLHSHACPRQVLGARMGLLAGRLLGLELPRADRRLLVIAETDGCLLDALSAATGCRAGRRTLRVEDYGKVAATFVDLEAGDAVRIAPHRDARALASRYAPEARSRWHAQLAGYQRMPDHLLLAWQWVSLSASIEAIVSRPGLRTACGACGEEVINQREVVREGVALCRACAGPAYYRPLPEAERTTPEAAARPRSRKGAPTAAASRVGGERVQPAPAAVDEAR
jgi:formylmethanofuran dehydrogenase subunit E